MPQSSISYRGGGGYPEIRSFTILHRLICTEVNESERVSKDWCLFMWVTMRCVCACACLRVCMYIYVSDYVPALMMSVCMFIALQMCVWVCKCFHEWMSECVCVCVCVCVGRGFIYVCVFMHWRPYLCSSPCVCRLKMPFHHVRAGLLYPDNYLSSTLSEGSEAFQLNSISPEELAGNTLPGQSCLAIVQPGTLNTSIYWEIRGLA